MFEKILVNFFRIFGNVYEDFWSDTPLVLGFIQARLATVIVPHLFLDSFVWVVGSLDSSRPYEDFKQ